MIEEQAVRFRQKASNYVHKWIAKLIVLIGFSFLGFASGLIYAALGSLVGSVY